jgi:hypothetical protein
VRGCGACGVIGFREDSVSIRAYFLAGVIVATMWPRWTWAQSGNPATTQPAAVADPFRPTTAKRVAVSKAVFGDAGIIVNARDDGFIEVAAAGPKKTIYLQLRTMAARAWVDSTARMMKARPKRSAEPKTYRADVTEYGTKTTMALTRTITAGESAYSLAFSDDPASAFTVPIEPSEADVFVAIMRKAATLSAKMLDKPDTTARPDSAPPVKKKKKPAAKQPASPPAKTPDTTSTQQTPTVFKAAPKPAATKPTPPA